MAQFWYDAALTKDGVRPSWVNASADTTREARGDNLFIVDRRPTRSFPSGTVIPGTFTDVDVRIRFRLYGVLNGAFANGGFGIYLRDTFSPLPNNRYSFANGEGSSYRETFYRTTFEGVTETGLSDSTAFPLSQEHLVWRFLRFRITGSTLQGKAWDDTINEPTTWLRTVVDGRLPPGGVRIQFPFATQYGADLAHIAIGSDGDEPPQAGRFSVGGIVRNENAQPVQREVRAYYRESGKLAGTALSDPTTGVYTISMNHAAEVQVVCLDDVAAVITRNDLIERTFPL